MGGRRCIPGRCKIIGIFCRIFSIARYRGLGTFFNYVPRVALAKPRFTLGFILAPASQAKSHFSC